MKMLIDIDRELAGGYMTPAHHERLKRLGRQALTDLALNTLIGFGAVAFTIGFGFVSQSLRGLMIEGAAIGIVGLVVVLMGEKRLRFLGHLLLVIGLLLFGGAAVTFDSFSARSVFAAAGLLFAAAMFVESGLLAGISVVTLSCALGASAAYQHAEYTMVIDRPLETVGVFALLAILLVGAATLLPSRERVLTIAARTAVLLVNFAFLVGSLWGDTVGETRISAGGFSVGWAVALLAVAIWAWHANRRWPLVTATVFAALHFYTQLFERLGAEPGTILIAGFATIAIGFGLKMLLARAEASAAGHEAATRQA